MWVCMCGEKNPDSSRYCQSCGEPKSSSEILKEKEEIYKKIREEEERREKIQQEFQAKMDNLIEMGLDGYYEYKVISLSDDNSGGINSSTIQNNLNNLGLDGWHLRCAYTNELGKNSNSSGYGGFSTSTNATIDQNILIFERFVRIRKDND